MVAAHGLTAALMWTLKTGAETDETLNDRRSQRAIRSATTWSALSALVLRRDPFGRFVSAIAWLPRDTFDTRLRERVGAMLARGVLPVIP